MPLKQDSVMDLIKKEHLDIVGVLETRVKHQNVSDILVKKFSRMQFIGNYTSHQNGRIWILWNPSTVLVSPISESSQMFIAMFCIMLLIPLSISLWCTLVMMGMKDRPFGIL